MLLFYQILNIFRTFKYIIMKHLLTLGAFVLFSFSTLHSQQIERVKGPVINDYGATYPVENPFWVDGKESELKVIFDVSESSEDKTVSNGNLEFAARFLNSHVNAGMNQDLLKVAMTVHANASHDILNDDAYKAIYGVNNPNTKLINELTNVGVDIVVCGQAVAKRNISREAINPNVKVALSATTAIIQYQNKGYQFVKY